MKALKNRAVAYWKTGENEMKVIVDFNKSEPENYLIVEALHNGKDVTAFFDFVDAEGEGLFIEKITEAIMEQIIEENYHNYKQSKAA